MTTATTPTWLESSGGAQFSDQAALQTFWGNRFLLLYMELVRTADWSAYPKFHQFAHLVEDCRENPALLWNYLDESEIGLCVELASMLHPKYVSVKLMERKRLDM